MKQGRVEAEDMLNCQSGHSNFVKWSLDGEILNIFTENKYLSVDNGQFMIIKGQLRFRQGRYCAGIQTQRIKLHQNMNDTYSIQAQSNQNNYYFQPSPHFYIVPNKLYLQIQLMTSILRTAGSQALNNSIRGMPNVQTVEAKIRAQVWKKQIRMKTFFEDYDKLRKGTCIQDKFISGLSTATGFLSLNLSNQQIRSVVDKYRIPPGDLIKYVQFVNNIDEQFFNTQLARSTLSNLKQNNQILSEQQSSTLSSLLSYIKWMISSQRILIKQQLQDYDRTKCSFITREQFVRVLDNLNLVRNQNLVDILCRRYARSINPKEIAYTDFIADVQDIKQVQSYVVKGIVPNERVLDANRNVIRDIHHDSITEEFYVDKKIPQKLLPIQQVMRKIQAQVTLKRIRIKQFFLDFDNLRKNIVTGDQFKRILGTMSLVLTDNEFNQIHNVYNVDGPNSREKRIKWMDFCEDIDTVFTIKGLDKNPLLKVSQIDKSVFEPVKHIQISFTQQEQASLCELLQNYQRAIANKRTHLKPLFQDFDITQIGYVTKNQFTRILKQFDFVPKNDNQFNLLLKKYMDRGNLNQVNYYQFIQDVDKYNQDGKNISKTYADSFINFQQKPRPNKANIRNQVPENLEDLLGRIRRKVKEERIRVAEFMKDFDKLRHGNITKDQFRLSLNMAKIPLSQAEFQIILNFYACENKAGYVQWKKFTDDLDQVFGLKQLEKTLPNEKLSLAQTTFNYGKRPIQQQENETANRIKQNFRQFQLSNRLDVKQLFENWDKLSRFKVSSKQFRQVLATVGFNLSEQENKAICKLYASDDERQSEVRYLEFLKDTKPYDFSYMTEIKETFKHGTGQKRSFSNDVEVVLEELRKTSKINRLRYREYFKDFDPLNKGTIKKNKFKSIVYQTMKLPLDQKLFEVIENHYGEQNDNTMINYERFCQDIDIVFNLPDKQKDPLVRLTNFDYTISHTKKEDQNIDSLMRRLGEVVRKHRLLLKSFFQDKDISKIGKVSFLRMRSILDNNKLPLTDYQYELLCKNFAYDNDEFNYVDFIEVLKQYEQES